MPSKRPASPPSATMSSGLGMEPSTARRVRPTALDRETPADIAHTPPTSTSVDLLARPDRSHKTLTTTLRRYLSDVPHHLTPLLHLLPPCLFTTVVPLDTPRTPRTRRATAHHRHVPPAQRTTAPSKATMAAAPPDTDPPLPLKVLLPVPIPSCGSGSQWSTLIVRERLA